MNKKKLTILAVLGLMASLVFSTLVMASPVAQKSVLGGTVTEVINVGTEVKEGDALLYVETIGGPMVAARASEAGKVVNVTVEKGAKVEVGQDIAAIENGK